MRMDITVAIATIPPRAPKLARALASVAAQLLQPAAISVAYDHHKRGAAATKNTAIANAATEWVAVLDDDDEMLPQHLLRLAEHALITGADVVYSIPTCPEMGGGPDGAGRYGVPFDAEELRRRSYIPTTSLFRTDLLVKVGGFQHPAGSRLDDWGAYLALLDAGAKFAHLPEQTWVWHIDGGNTSGLPDRW